MAVNYPITAAVRVLRQHGVPFEPRLYAYEPRGGTRVSARELGVSEHQVIKTLIFEDEQKQPLCILMHCLIYPGDWQRSSSDPGRRTAVRRPRR